MDRRQIGLSLVLNTLELESKVDSFDDRLILQKAMYLAQAAGVDLGYYYGWYLRGPYCPAVADDGFAVTAELGQGMDDSDRWKLDDKSSSSLAKIKSFFGQEDRTVLADKLELLASIHYLIDREQVTDQSPPTITAKLHACDKMFSEQQVSEAIEELKTHGLLD